ncbi:glutaminase A [Streptomyces sp. A5-4]|uniref:glutaminase A n=1 Tax=Streptomyces sp. A5-4 TaxID=3384771 RepID=UPI003DA9E987
MVMHEPVTDALTQVHARLAGLRDGRLADYIPQLALADPDAFGLALVSMEGHQYRAGRAQTPFTVQSVSKPFVYALVLAELGPAEVTRWVDAEPSGEAFNAISLEPGTGRPANAMINAGAIACTALVPGPTGARRFDRILGILSRFAGRALDVDESVYASESASGNRNRALAYLMSSTGSLPGDPSEAVDTYFRQCAVRVTAVDLAVMVATLANGGTNPVTGKAVVPEPVAVQVLAVMASCGMYDASGKWLLRVGLPAKSGVAGGLVAASPARFGVAAFSPPLDPAGTPVRGAAAMRELSERFGLHLMHNPARSAPTVSLSSRQEERVTLVAAQGAIDFTAAERLLHELSPVALETGGGVVLDLADVMNVDACATAMVRAALTDLCAQGHPVAVVGRLGSAAAGPGWRSFVSRQEAVAWCAEAPSGRL